MILDRDALFERTGQSVRNETNNKLAGSAGRKRQNHGSVQNLSHFRFGWAAPGPGSRGDGTSHLILQQLDIEISLGRPCRAGDVA